MVSERKPSALTAAAPVRLLLKKCGFLSGTNYTFHHDHLQSVTALTGHNGQVEETAEYGPFGETDGENGSGNFLAYTGREFDPETGLYYYRARFYDPEIGRFLNEDPLGFEAGVNFYAYVSNNPINANDPMGLLAPPIHYLTTFVGGLSSGLGFGESASLAYNTMAVDWRTETFNADAAVQAGHGTGGINVKTGEVQFPYENVPAITAQINANLPDDLASALHNGQDYATPMHREGVYTGVRTDQGIGTFFKDVGNFVIHTVGDWFPSLSTISQAFSSTTTLINAHQTGTNVGLSPGGNISAAGGFVLYPNKSNTNMMRSVYEKRR